MLDLEAIELIKQLKARYFRYVDTCDLEGLKTVFSDRAQAYFKGANYEFSLTGWDQLKTFYQQAVTPVKFGIHNGHHPEISVCGNRATGVWYLQDTFINLEESTTLTGSALYNDKYINESGQWKILYTGYKRLFEQIEKRNKDTVVTVNPLTS